MLDALLEKLGLKYEKLSAEERKTYQAWADVLIAKDPTLDDVKNLVAAESARAFEELQKWDNTPARELYYKALTNLATTMHKFIATPAAQREAMKAHLRQVFHIDV
jgi:hypothetical protein